MAKTFKQTVLKEVYKCYSVSVHTNREALNQGGKIFLPQSALTQIPLNDVPSPPMLFKLTNNTTGQLTHAGVLEFTADEGTCYIPDWMKRFLTLEDGDELNVEYISLPVATFAKFQPIGGDFLDITNPKAVLESELRRFACLTVGDIIAIYYNSRVYELRVLELSPAKAVSIIYCDMNVEFEQPEGYADANGLKNESSLAGLNVVASFEGKGNRLDGKNKKSKELQTTKKRTPLLRGIPDFSYRYGELRFLRNNVNTKALIAPTIIQANGSSAHFPGNGFLVQQGEEEVD